MAAITTTQLTYRYGSTVALDHLDLSVPEGAVYGLLGPNGSGKTTLMQLLTGMRRMATGHATILGTDVRALGVRDRQRIGYIAEGQKLPAWMRLDQFEAYLAPLYPTWDFALANALRDRFDLDARKKLGTLSRGTAMKASLLCALAPRPQLLLMDEPFTGMDAIVKDEIVRGLLDTAASDGWTVLLCSHDIAEVEMLVDWIGLLRNGHLMLSESMESLRARLRRVEIVSPSLPDNAVPSGALRVERSGHRVSFYVTTEEDAKQVSALMGSLPEGARVDLQEVPLREAFIAIAGSPAAPPVRTVA